MAGGGVRVTVKNRAIAAALYAATPDASVWPSPDQGKKWSSEFWRKEDMVAYMFRYASLSPKSFEVLIRCSQTVP